MDGVKYIDCKSNILDVFLRFSSHLGRKNIDELCNKFHISFSKYSKLFNVLFFVFVIISPFVYIHQHYFLNIFFTFKFICEKFLNQEVKSKCLKDFTYFVSLLPKIYWFTFIYFNKACSTSLDIQNIITDFKFDSFLYFVVY